MLRRNIGGRSDTSARPDGARTSSLAQVFEEPRPGNALARVRKTGDAKGFTLASSARMAATKSTDASAVSVLDFAARKALTGDGEHDLPGEARAVVTCCAAIGIAGAGEGARSLGAVLGEDRRARWPRTPRRRGLAEHVAAASAASIGASSAVLQCSKFVGRPGDCAHLFGALQDAGAIPIRPS